MKKNILLFSIIFILQLCACGGTSILGENQDGEIYWANHFQFTKTGQLLTLESTEEGKNRFCILEKNRHTYVNCLDNQYDGLLYDDEKDVLYSYNRDKKRLEVLDLKFELTDCLLEDVSWFEVKKIDRIGEILLLLVVENNPYIDGNEEQLVFGENGYVDFGEKIISIDVKTKQYSFLEIEKPICMTVYKDKLFVNVYQGDEYSMLSYSPLDGIREEVELFSLKEYISSFVIEDNRFVYSSLTGMIYDQEWFSKENRGIDGIFVIKNSDIQAFDGTIYVLDHSSGKIIRVDEQKDNK